MCLVKSASHKSSTQEVLHILLLDREIRGIGREVVMITECLVVFAHRVLESRKGSEEI